MVVSFSLSPSLLPLASKCSLPVVNAAGSVSSTRRTATLTNRRTRSRRRVADDACRSLPAGRDTRKRARGGTPQSRASAGAAGADAFTSVHPRASERARARPWPRRHRQPIGRPLLTPRRSMIVSACICNYGIGDGLATPSLGKGRGRGGETRVPRI